MKQDSRLPEDCEESGRTSPVSLLTKTRDFERRKRDWAIDTILSYRNDNPSISVVIDDAHLLLEYIYGRDKEG